MLLTIFTPTYNRAYILPSLYESLVNQSSKDFEWVIVDDGSTDETESIVKKWIAESRICIKYIKQENQGKHIAINTGTEHADGELFFIVDSDDSLKNHAVSTILEFWMSNNDPDVSGIIGYREFTDGSIVGSKLPPYVKKCKLRDCRRLGSEGDKVVIYRTDIFKQYKYPKFGNERFLGESYVFNQIDDHYDMLVMNERIYLFAYQPDGLSQNFRVLYQKNPLGFKAFYEQSIKYSDSLCNRTKILTHLWCLGIATKDFSSSVKSILGFLTLPMGIALYLKIFVLKISDVKPYEQSKE